MMKIKSGLRLFFMLVISMIIQLNIIAQNKEYKGGELFGKPEYDFKFGKIEVRMMAAKGSGILSTFYLWKANSDQSNVFWEEIDIEIFGKDSANEWQSNIFYGYDPLKSSEEIHTQNNSLADDFHTFSIEWSPAYISWKLDGEEVRSITGSPATYFLSPAGIRFNLWASTSAEWAGPWDDSILPQYQFVNWVKYYRYENGEFILDSTEDFDILNTSRWSKANWTWEGNRVDFEPENVVVQDGMLILCLTNKNELGFSGIIPQDTTNLTSVEDENLDLPNNHILNQNYPNPFNPNTTIEYTVPYSVENANVKIIVFDILGKKTTTLVDRSQIPGNYKVDFSADDLASGLYYYRLSVGDFVETKKMILLK